MTSYSLSEIFSFSIAIAAVIGLFRFKNILFSYKPFIYIVWTAFLSEIISAVLIKGGGSNAVNSNIYVLVESLLFLWLFKGWGAMQKRNWYMPVLCSIVVLVWIYDHLILNKITEVGPIFRILVSFILIFLSIDQINKLIVQEMGNILYNPRFLICIGVVIFYSYKATTEIFFLKLSMSANFSSHIFLILEYVNLLVNLIYALAVLWIPTKQKFTLPS
jgi:hypothetical protein